jgi:DNA-directed RNA polymerase subunit M
MFCPVCRSLMAPKDGQFFCRKCQAFRELPGQPQKSMLVTSAKQEQKEVVVLEGNVETLPRTQDVECPECGTRDAWWFLRQTRKSDEAETMFLECTKCRHRWRRY